MDYSFQKYFQQNISNIRGLHHKGNNSLFEITTNKGRFLLKKYSDRIPFSKIHKNIWTRGLTEFRALNYLWSKGFRNIPQPISFFEQENIGIYSYEEGKILNQKKINQKNIKEAVDFLSKIHNLDDKTKFPPATSACLCLLDYIEVIDKRIKKIIDYKPEGELGERARNFLDKKVCPKIEELKKDFLKKTKRINLEKEFSIDEQVLTPADFGFHNILIDKGEKYCFLDFEYFGRDDSVRQILDFIHHDQSFNIDKNLKNEFLKLYIKKRNPPESFKNRLKLIDPLIGMTWVLIYLNVLSKDYMEKIKKTYGNTDDLFKERLIKAEVKLKNLYEIEQS